MNELRSFAFIIGGGLAAVWAYRFFVRGRPGLLFIGLGVVLAILGACCPRVLREPHRAWMAIGELLGSVVSRVLLSIFYIIVLTPIALVRRMFVRDPLELRFREKVPSYFHAKRIQPRKQLERMFS